MKRAKELVVEVLKKADIVVNGTRPWDIRIHNDRWYKRLLSEGTIAVGESYMDGWWDCKSIDQAIDKILRAQLHKRFKPGIEILFYLIRARLTNMQNVTKAFEVGEQHYDIGNDLYERMLDPWMQYSCGYWTDNVTNLNEAQETKLDLIARKLKLEPGMRVLDVGCGWGGLAKYLAEKHGVSVVGLTISKEQAVYAKEWTKRLPVEIIVADYRTYTTEPFDRIVSVGMFEHVGHKNYRAYMEHMHRLLKDDGIFLLHTIGRSTTTFATDPWIHKYIFPNGMLPSPTQVGEGMEKLFVMEDWHNFGAHYDRTLMAWYQNFESAWTELKGKDRYNDRFYRMWKYYLLSCAGLFRSRDAHLWQIVLTKNGVAGGYQSVR